MLDDLNKVEVMLGAPWNHYRVDTVRTTFPNTIGPLASRVWPTSVRLWHCYVRRNCHQLFHAAANLGEGDFRGMMDKLTKRCPHESHTSHLPTTPAFAVTKEEKQRVYDVLRSVGIPSPDFDYEINGKVKKQKKQETAVK